MMGEVGDTSELCNQALKSAVERYRLLQYQALLQAQKQGTVRQDRSAESMANLLVNNWQGALLRMKIEQSTQPLQEFYDTLLSDYFIAG
jgi:TetR/AcrR family transcriptional repressor of nem operon